MPRTELLVSNERWEGGQGLWRRRWQITNGSGKKWRLGPKRTSAKADGKSLSTETVRL
tara:strand:- start:86 stop:259 length:174 start_codon:yes stop_codon:yes gene_type:complete